MFKWLARLDRYVSDLVDSGRRGSEWRGKAYSNRPFAIFGGGAEGQFRDANEWRVVVPWLPIAEATQGHVKWRDALDLPADEVQGHSRVEVRGDNGGEMRVLASPTLLPRSRS